MRPYDNVVNLNATLELLFDIVATAVFFSLLSLIFMIIVGFESILLCMRTILLYVSACRCCCSELLLCLLLVDVFASVCCCRMRLSLAI